MTPFNFKRVALLIVLSLNIAGLIYFFDYFFSEGYLPSPFIFDKSNTFMDLFNVLYWAYDDGRYTTWSSVYPPLNFLLLRFLNFLGGGAVVGDPDFLRDNSLSVVNLMCLLYFIMPLLVLRMKYWDGIFGADKFIIYLIIVFSSPMLFTLERGNLILLAPFFLALLMLEKKFLRSLSLGILINLKPYFAILTIHYIVKRKWQSLFSCVLNAGLIFTITGLILDNNYLIFFQNILSFYNETSLFSLREVMALPSSISAFSYVLKHPDGQYFVLSILNPFLIEAAIYSTEIVKWAVIIFSLIAISIRRGTKLDVEVITLLVVLISNMGVWVGGYTMILYMALVPIFVSMKFRVLYIALLCAIALPVDVISLYHNQLGEQYVYLSTLNVEIQWTLGAGSILRPLCNMILLFSISYELFNRNNVYAVNKSKI